MAKRARIRTTSAGELFSVISLLRVTLIFAAILFIYGPGLHGDWLMDDDLYITRNPLLNQPSRLWKAWFQPGSFMEYYPLEQSLQWMQWQLWHGDTLGYHITNVVLHFISALLVWHLLARFGLKFAWLGGLIFAVHPVMVESVAWIAEFKNTLSLPPFLLAMIFYLEFETRGKRRDYFLALLFFVVAMLCKISMASFPLAILLFAWWKRGQISWNDVKASAPFFAVSLGLGLLSLKAGTWYVNSHHLVAWDLPAQSFLSRLAVTGLSIAFYFWDCLWPFGLLPVYPQWRVNPPSLMQFLPWPILAGILYGFWTQRLSWGKHALLGFGYFLILIGPFVTINVGGFMTFTWVMDHFLYIPIIGLIGLAVAGVGVVAENISTPFRFLGGGILGLILTVLTWQSHGYAALFISQEPLWTYTIQHNPDAWPAHNNLGNIYYEKGQLEQAMQEYLAVIRLNPFYLSSRCSMAHIRQVSGDLDGALNDYNLVLKTSPGNAEAYYGRAQIWLARRDWGRALQDLLMVNALTPYSSYAGYSHLLIWRVRIGQNEAVQADQELAATLAQGWNSSPDAWVTQVARFLLGQVDESTFFQRAQSPVADIEEERMCEAWYFAGIKSLSVHDVAAATIAFRKCVATKQRTCVQYGLALSELEAL